MEQSYTATHLANYFIKNISYVNNIKLNKLVYITYGIGLAIYNKEFFIETIQAWKLGPVIPSVYHEFKRYGYNKITETSYMFDIELNVDKEDKYVNSALKAVAKHYGVMSSADLIQKTHKEGAPWSECFQKNINNIPIKKETIKEYYKKLLKK